MPVVPFGSDVVVIVGAIGVLVIVIFAEFEIIVPPQVAAVAFRR